MWIAYEVLLLLALLLYYVPSAMWRRRLPHRGWSMRLGCYPASVTQRLQARRGLWMHAVSVGEVLAVRPLLKGLAQSFPDDSVVLSTITPSGFALAAQQLTDHGAAIYFPLDVRWCVRRALAAIQPRLLLLVESELWPTVIRLTKARQVPIAVINGRISARAFRRYLWVKPWVVGLLGRIDLFLMQSQTDADRVISLGAPPERVHVVGSLKWDASVGTRPTRQAVQDTAARLGLADRTIVIVAGSTHRGEEDALLKAFRVLRQRQQHVHLIIAPRHLERLAEVEALVRQHGLVPTRASLRPSGAWDVGIVDVFGQMPAYYGLATVVFIGGSLIPHGGQNPLEATSVGKAVVFGPHMHNFETIAHQLLAHHAARQATDAGELSRLLEELIGNDAEAQAMGRRAQELTERFQGATQRTLDALTPLLARR